MISRYLESLSAELRVPARLRARILAEARDHLHEAVSRRLERGISARQAESEAIEAFGDPHDVAARFHEQLASSSAHRASTGTALLMGGLLIGFAVALFGRDGGFPAGLVIWVGAQIAVVAAVLGLGRSLRYRDGGTVPAARLPDLYRANGLAVACVGMVSLAEGLDAVTSGASSNAGLAAGSAVMLGASLAAGRSVAHAIARARVLPAPAAAPSEDALDDLLAVARLASGAVERRAPRLAAGAGRLVREAHEVAQRRPALARWLDLRRSPWRFCLLFAAACGIAVAAQHGVADGGLSVGFSSPARALAAAAIIASIEAAAVIACFAAFGRFLGIRR